MRAAWREDWPPHGACAAGVTVTKLGVPAGAVASRVGGEALPAQQAVLWGFGAPYQAHRAVHTRVVLVAAKCFLTLVVKGALRLSALNRTYSSYCCASQLE